MCIFVCLNTTVASAQKKQKSATERQQEEKQGRKKQKPQKRKSPAVSGAFSEYGRRDRIRTYDPLVPNQLRYQAALLAERLTFHDDGAKGGTWTPTSVRTLTPEASASTNSATLAGSSLQSCYMLLNGVANGTRTHDDWNHNPGLYQLSYSHHNIATFYYLQQRNTIP